MSEEKAGKRPEEVPSESEGKKGVKEDKETEKKEPVKLTAGMKDIMETLEKMTVLELSDFVKALEDKFDVSAQAPMAMSGMVMAQGAQGAGQAVAEEQTAFTVILAAIGSNKIQVIKEIRAITTLGLKEAKELVEAAPKTVKEGATKEEAEKIKAQLEKTGARVELK